MSSAGITRAIDGLGRIVVPVEFRRALGIGHHDLVEISLDTDRIVLTRVERSCVFCASTTDLREHRDRPVCAECVATLSPPGRSDRG
jgi:transcriptional pleiotropic regulator of transition state genes